MRIGLPRALLFHHYGECWSSFLSDLGFEPVISENTTGDTVIRGTVVADNEACLPVKVFAGHLLELSELSDAILVPRVVSQQRGMKACPKYLGLPDLARSMDSAMPPVLAPVMDLGATWNRWAREWYEIAVKLGVGAEKASHAVRKMVSSLRAGITETVEPTPSDFRVGVAGHLYNVHDHRVSLGLLDRIREMGAEPLTVEQVPRRLVRRELKALPRKIKWEFENRIVGAVLHWNRAGDVAGVIYLNSFACGPGSMIGALIDDELSREGSVPLMTITLDEHSGETGMVTRIEAFLDMLRRSRIDTAPGARDKRGGGGE
jgi:predicted nucleotide-binding protein (sugar kinase/HSP70/actin superfamily)